MMVKDILAANAAVTPESRNLALLRRDFPQCFSKDGVFNPDKLSELVKSAGGAGVRDRIVSEQEQDLRAVAEHAAVDECKADGKNAWLREMFERLLAEWLDEELKRDNSADYAAYLQTGRDNLAACHAGFFARDKQRQRRDGGERGR